MNKISELLVFLNDGSSHSITTNLDPTELTFLAWNLKKKDKHDQIKEIRPNYGGI